METIRPDIHESLKKYSAVTENIAIEFPPQMAEIPLTARRNIFLSMGAEPADPLFQWVQKCGRSAVILPGKDKLCSAEEAALEETEKLGEYLHEADPAVVKAGLSAELSQKTKTALYFSGKAVFFTGDGKINSPFFKNSFKVVDSCRQDEHEIIAALKKHKAGKVILRFTIEPKEYWNVRGRIEAKLTGSKTYALLYLNDRAIVVEKY